MTRESLESMEARQSKMIREFGENTQRRMLSGSSLNLAIMVRHMEHEILTALGIPERFIR